MQEDRLRSVAYDPPDGPSIFDAWEAGISTSLVPPLSVVDAGYRAHIVGILRDHLRPGRRLVSVGAGNGNVEVELAKAGWDVLATDVSDSALRICRGKGLRVARLDLVSASPTGPFDMIYCDGVLGHLWQPNSGCTQSWSALALLAHLGSRCLVSNDLADDDMDFQLAVRSTPGAAYFAPPNHSSTMCIGGAGRRADASNSYCGSLMHKWIKANNRAQLSGGECATLRQVRQQRCLDAIPSL
jgi:SAM-dependent methyltransferase